ncbi:MAG: cell envelope integrity protein TolA [Gammaproteobacteria bacterium]|nr:cell envelope integrity protein TolA [Gammaproteobacteria bacterium]
MSTTDSYIVSFILALAFHAAVVGLLMSTWDDNEVFESFPIRPYYIEATVVRENPYTVKKRQEQARRDAEQKELTTMRRADEEKARLNQEAIVKAKRLDVEKQIAEQKKREEAINQEELTKAASQEIEIVEVERLKMEQSLTLSILEEQEYRRAITDDEKALAYVSQIQRDIIQNWSRPPSARNGMQALLRVFLVPTGEVVNVVVEESSGNDAFDRSALLAVRKIERFQVPGQSRQFERNFREFTVLFRPEDLRL